MSCSIAFRRLGMALTVLSAVNFFAGPLFVQRATAQASADQTIGKFSVQELQRRQDWHLGLAQVPFPKKGCFEATYPERQWHEVTCRVVPLRPMLPHVPKRGVRPLTVGNTNDVTAHAPTGTISTAIGTFQSVSNVTSEAGQINASGGQVNNAYTLQLNTNTFSPSSACSGSPNPGCKGWEQFVFENDGSGNSSAYIQYWIIQYNKTCPTGQSWTQFSFPSDTDIYCYKNNSGGAASVSTQPIGNLGLLSLTGAISAAGDSVSLFDGTVAHGKTGDNAVGASSGWTSAEFNIFGDAGGGQANFNPGAAIVPKTRVIYGGTSAPDCSAVGFTGETNNLTFDPTNPTPTNPGPALAASESSAGGATSNCAAATGIGDPHLKTFGDLFYDFQATGDFLLAQSGADFVVQNRQVSGAPTWPNAAVNQAIAARMGTTKVAVCVAPTRINVNGTNVSISDKEPFSNPDGVAIWKRGNTYLITDSGGNSVRAVVNASWIDVTVGLGQWPAQVSGLLAGSFRNNSPELATREGAALSGEISFADFYHRFGDGWRVSDADTLLNACGQRGFAAGNPSRSFYASDLDRPVYEHARGVCTGAGVHGATLLDACTLDVAVIGSDDAAKVYVGMPEPTHVLTITGGGGDHGGIAKWWLWLIVILLLLLAILWWRRRKTV